MSSKSDSFLKAGEFIIDDQKSLALLSYVPLALIVSQLRFLVGLEFWLVKFLATTSILAFLISGALSFFSISYARAFLAVQNLHDNEFPTGESLYFKYVIKSWSVGRFPLTDEAITNFAEKVVKPILIALGLGWACVMFLLFLFIWSDPTPLSERHHDRDEFSVSRDDGVQ